MKSVAWLPSSTITPRRCDPQSWQAIVDVCDKLLDVEVPGKYEADIELPYEVDDAASDAAFDR